MTQAEKLKYIRAMVLSAAAAAGIGAYARNKKSKKTREDAMDFASSSNSIIVPVNKKKFLEGVKTPEEQKAEFEGKKKIEPDGNLMLPSPAEGQEAPKDIASIKKDILKRRKFDFFGKRAASKDSRREDEKSEPVKHDQDVLSEEKIDGRIVMRGQDGKFVSPSDPVAVQEVEKIAGIIEDFKSGFKGHPVMLTAGAIGSVMLAAKISDMINERRREKAKERLEDERSRYVSMLGSEEGSEKAASGDSDSLSGLGGRVVGTAFLLPLALTAMVTNKIIENRKAEKKRQKEMSDSYPQDPTILYKTYDGDTLKIAADTALMAIMVKRAMIDDAERAETGIMKRAQFARGGGMWIDPTNGAGNIGDDVEFAVKNMTDPKNRKNLLRFIKAQQEKDEQGMESAYRDMMPLGTALGNHYNVARTPEFKRMLASNKALQNAVIANLESDKDWKAYRDSKISDRIAGWNLDRGGILHKIIMWLANAFGFGNSMARKYVLSGFDSARDRYQSQIDKMEQEAMKNHFAPLENFKGTQQERDKLENDLNDSWMAKKVDRVNDPKSFETMAENLGRLSPQSPQYKVLYDALSKKKGLNPAAFGSLPPPSNAPSPAPGNGSKAQPADSVEGNSNPAPAQPQPQNQQGANAAPTYGGFGLLPQYMKDALLESMRGGAGSEVGAQESQEMDAPSAVAEPYSGDSKKGPSPNNADIDDQQYTGSEAPDYAAPSVPSAQAAGLQERAPSYGDASWRTLAQEAQRRSGNSPHGLENPGLNELLKLETGRRINPQDRPHDNPAWDTIGLASKLMETPRRPNPVTPSNPPQIRPPRPELSSKEQADMIDDAIRNPVQPVQSESARPTPQPVSPTAFQPSTRFRPGANEWTNHVESNPPELYNYPVGDYAKSDLGQ